jgi:hypothetical protein
MSEIDWGKYKGNFVKWETVGQTVDGTVVDMRTGSYKGKDYPELVVHEEDGDRIVSASQGRLQRQLADDPPGLGDALRVEYLGEGPSRGDEMHPPKLFKVTVTHRGPAPDVDDLA